MPTSRRPDSSAVSLRSLALLALATAGLTLALSSGCGGEASGQDPEGAAGQAGAASGQSSRKPICGNASFYELDDTSAACPWIYEGWCFEEREDACLCACGREKGDTCISGFPGDEVAVSCPSLGGDI